MGATRKYKLAWMALFGLAYVVLYLLPNFHPYFTPLKLPLFTIDKKVPFLPWTFTIYFSDYLLAMLVIVQIQELTEFKALSRNVFLGLMLSATFFVLSPTTYPRPAYPTNEILPIQMLLDLVASADRPTNCFPSMHVATAAIFTWSMRHRRHYYLYWIWTLAIAASTLTTKQHYFLDIIGGFIVMAVVASLDHFLFEKRMVRSPPAKVSH
jgi:membrane-associated phospholipid phosphatase